jgi:hypothetical protein
VDGVKYLTCTAICMVVVLLGFTVVLGQFNMMVYPACISAVSINTDDKGTCQLELLGEKAQLPVPDLEHLVNRVTQNYHILTENMCRTVDSWGRGARQAWETGVKGFLPEGQYEQLLNTIETGVLLPLKERLQRASGCGP